MDIYDGTDWTEMDIDDLKAAIESGCTIQDAAGRIILTSQTRNRGCVCRGSGNGAWAYTIRSSGQSTRAHLGGARVGWFALSRSPPRHDMLGS
jgi:hypothetical protein